VQHHEGQPLERGAPTCGLLACQILLRRSSSLTRPKILTLVVRVKGVRKRGQFLILICEAAKATPRHGPQVESRVRWRDLSRHESR